jgi:NAD-dependent DNA ligase
MTFVKELGFNVVLNQAMYYDSLKDKVDVRYVIEDFEKYKERRDEGVYPIDGIIFRIDSNEDFEECGWTSHHPKGCRFQVCR